MSCRNINLSLDNVINVTGDLFTMVDDFGNYVFYNLDSTQASGTFSVDISSSNFTLTSFTQSGVYSSCYNPTYDGDATAFIIAGEITDETQKSAIHRLTIDLKSNNLWNKLKCIYPFVGGTELAHRQNLKISHIQDVVAFKLSFYGGFTHSSNGVYPNGSNGYAAISFSPSTHLSGTSSVSLGYYSRTTTSTNAMAFSNVSGNRLFLYLKFASGDLTIFDCYRTTGGFRVSTTGVNTSGFLIGSRVSSTDSRLYKNGSQIGTTQTTLMVNSPSTGFMDLFRQSPGTLYSNCECAFAFIGDGLTSDEVSTLNTIVNTFQTTLGRNV